MSAWCCHESAIEAAAPCSNAKALSRSPASPAISAATPSVRERKIGTVSSDAVPLCEEINPQAGRPCVQLRAAACAEPIPAMERTYVPRRERDREHQQIQVSASCSGSRSVREELQTLQPLGRSPARVTVGRTALKSLTSPTEQDFDSTASSSDIHEHDHEVLSNP